MIRKYIDIGLITLGCILILASFYVFSIGKREGQNFRNIVAQIKFLKDSVQTKMAGSVAWFKGEEEEKINAFGLGLTASGSAARYLYLNKIQIISLDDSLIEFLPEDELKLSKGSVMVLNPDGKVKLADKAGVSKVIKEGTLYTSTDKGIVETPAKWQKSWIPEGDSYSVSFQNNILSELFLLAPPALSIDHFGTACIGKIEPVAGDAGDVIYEVKGNGNYLKLTDLNVVLPTAKTILEVRSVAGSVSSVWREIQLPAHCVTEILPVYPEDLSFFAITNQEVELDRSDEFHTVVFYFAVEEKAEVEITGPNIDRQASLQGEFKKEYKLPPGKYVFKLSQEGRVLTKVISVKVKPKFKIKDSIFIEE